MMSLTHAVFSVSLTSLVLGTANPEVLGTAAVSRSECLRQRVSPSRHRYQ